MGHLLLPSGLDVALVVARKTLKERCGVDDVGVRRHRERLGDLRRDQDLDVSRGDAASRGVRQFSHDGLRVTAARIMGIESDHRTLARVVTPGVVPQDGGPIETVTGIQGIAESVDPPNNNGYERTLGWTQISQALTALLPFASKDAAMNAGFDTSQFYRFNLFTPALPSPLGEFHSFTG